MLIDNRKLGEQGETVALNFLLTKGYTLIDRNYRAMRCEIDLIMKAPNNEIVFVEVKARTNQRYILGRQAVNKSKQFNIIKAAEHFVSENNCYDAFMRFDVIEVDMPSKTVVHIENAFVR